MNQSVKNVLIMSIVISDEYGKRVDYGKYKIYYVHGRTDEERQFIVFPERRKNVYIPIENTKEIYCMNEVTVNTKLLDFCHRITLSYIFQLL